MTLKTPALPSGALPLGLNIYQAAEFIGVSTTKYREMVNDGRMPKPIFIDGRRVWDRCKVENAFEALSDDGSDGATNPWDQAIDVEVR